MADNYDTLNNEVACDGNFKEAVCIDAYRVYDSCGDKDCLEDLRVYFTEAGQNLIDRSCNVRMRSVDVLTVYLDLEPVPFHKGFYSVDMTFFFEVCVDAFQAPAAPPVTVCGLSIFNKRVVLYGSEGNVKVFSSDFSLDDLDTQNAPVRNLPKATVQVSAPNRRIFSLGYVNKMPSKEPFDDVHRKRPHVCDLCLPAESVPGGLHPFAYAADCVGRSPFDHSYRKRSYLSAC